MGSNNDTWKKRLWEIFKAAQVSKYDWRRYGKPWWLDGRWGSRCRCICLFASLLVDSSPIARPSLMHNNYLRYSCCEVYPHAVSKQSSWCMCACLLWTEYDCLFLVNTHLWTRVSAGESRRNMINISQCWGEKRKYVWSSKEIGAGALYFFHVKWDA